MFSVSLNDHLVDIINLKVSGKDIALYITFISYISPEHLCENRHVM